MSTPDQTTAPQEEALKSAGCKRIYRDTASGARSSRPGLDALLDAAREGDTVVVWKLDRLGRSLPHLLKTVSDLEKEGKGFRSITENIDTSNPSGRLVFHLFASLAQFERDLIHERIRAGVASARARGLSGGRPRALDEKKAKLAARLMGDRSRNVNDIARTLGISRSTLYRLAREQPPAVTSPSTAATPAGSTTKRPRKATAATSRPTATKLSQKPKKPTSRKLKRSQKDD